MMFVTFLGIDTITKVSPMSFKMSRVFAGWLNTS